jgi:hypothetical protein
MNPVEENAANSDKETFEIELLEERIAPSVIVGYGENQSPWVESGGGQVFLGHDPA